MTRRLPASIALFTLSVLLLTYCVAKLLITGEILWLILVAAAELCLVVNLLVLRRIVRARSRDTALRR